MHHLNYGTLQTPLSGRQVRRLMDQSGKIACTTEMTVSINRAHDPRHSLQVNGADPSRHKVFRFDRGRHIVKLGPKWNYSAAWSYLDTHRNFIEALAQENNVDPHDICLSEWSFPLVFFFVLMPHPQYSHAHSVAHTPKSTLTQTLLMRVTPSSVNLASSIGHSTFTKILSQERAK
jgi:hypothetical protein